TPICGRARSSSVKPMAFIIERATARSGPSSRTRLLCLGSVLMGFADRTTRNELNEFLAHLRAGRDAELAPDPTPTALCNFFFQHLRPPLYKRHHHANVSAVASCSNTFFQSGANVVWRARLPWWPRPTSSSREAGRTGSPVRH